ncbi:MAG: AlpA family transcriptional regulator [Gammaproteobacteria bacterium]|nr:AlpA family transcriptional regulator [Gammaproteobacteria bacterium]
MPQKILRLPKVSEITGLSRSTIYLKVSQRLFPSPILLGKRSVGWIESEINNWIDQQINYCRISKNDA